MRGPPDPEHLVRDPEHLVRDLEHLLLCDPDLVM
jgi:hypothetical protein